MSSYCDERSPQLISGEASRKKNGPCPQLPGTILRIFFPAGTTINLLNLIEVTSPSGICIIVRLPFLGDSKGFPKVLSVDTIKNAVERMGGTVEFVE